MDIIISAEQGAGKTSVAWGILNRALDNGPSGCLYEVAEVGDNASALAQNFRVAKPDAILFDGCISTAAEMLTAVEAVKKYREQTGRPRTLALYVVQADSQAVVLTDKAIAKPATEAKHAIEALVLDEANPRRSAAILYSLWTGVACRATDDEATALIMKVVELIPDAAIGTGLGISNMSPDQMSELHSFLLDMQRKQNERSN